MGEPPSGAAALPQAGAPAGACGGGAGPAQKARGS